MAYMNDDGDIWIERGSGTWPQIQREARATLDMIDEPEHSMVYLGLEKDVRVSDVHEYVHYDDDGCADAQDVSLEARELPVFEPCCRTVEAHHFRCDGER